MKKKYRKEVNSALNRINFLNTEIISEKDLDHLPPVVKKYLIYVNVVGKGRVKNVRIKFDGRIRSKPEDNWMNFSTEQYNFFDRPARIFYIKALKFGLPVKGIHLYKDEKAIMIIKLAGIFKFVDAKGIEMDQGETVTVFNDMCFMAPATLIDQSIHWEPIDDLTVKAIYTNGNISISAILYFNEEGRLINFISNDRFETVDGKTYISYPWSTPIKEYSDVNGSLIASSASTIFHRPEGDFCYGEFNVKEIEYNCPEFK